MNVKILQHLFDFGSSRLHRNESIERKTFQTTITRSKMLEKGVIESFRTANDANERGTKRIASETEDGILLFDRKRDCHFTFDVIGLHHIFTTHKRKRVFNIDFSLLLLLV